MPNANPLETMEDAESLLYARIDYERTATIPYQEHQLKLQRMRDLLQRLGNPHEGIPCLHVAGTKGKGSTCAMLNAMLVANGYRVGMYTSPHFHSMLERLRCDGKLCDQQAFIELVRQVQPAIEAMDADPDPGNHPTFFEVFTALAFLFFRRQEVDIAVMEVGLGGRLDSTNVCEPVVSLITSISLDHMAQLGNDLASIAQEKAGIIKRAIPVVCGVRQQPARGVIEQVATREGAPLISVGTHYDFVCDPHASTFDYQQSFASPPASRTSLELLMRGVHQAHNAANALAALDVLRNNGWKFDESLLRQGLCTTLVPGRIEVVHRRPTVILDAAHNAASMESLLKVLDDDYPGVDKIFVFGTTRGKDVDGMFALLAPRFDRLILTNYHINPRSHSATALAKLLEAIPAINEGGTRRIQYEVVPRCEDAWDRALDSASRDALICVCGSFFLVAELEPRIRQQLSGR